MALTQRLTVYTAHSLIGISSHLISRRALRSSQATRHCPFMQMRLRDSTWLTQGHMAAKRADLNLGSDSPSSTFSTLQNVTPAGFSHLSSGTAGPLPAAQHGCLRPSPCVRKAAWYPGKEPLMSSTPWANRFSETQCCPPHSGPTPPPQGCARTEGRVTTTPGALCYRDL